MLNWKEWLFVYTKLLYLGLFFSTFQYEIEKCLEDYDAAARAFVKYVSFILYYYITAPPLYLARPSFYAPSPSFLQLL